MDFEGRVVLRCVPVGLEVVLVPSECLERSLCLTCLEGCGILRLSLC